MTRGSSRRAGVSAAAALSLSIATTILAAQQIVLPAPSGPYAIGTTIRHWIDWTRRETAPGHERHQREIVTQLWYPAAASNASPAPYIPDFARIAKYGKELNDRGLTLIGRGIDRLERLATHARLDAPISTESPRWPVLLFSPGNSVPRSIYTVLVEDLASRGFVVVAIDHPYSVGVAVLSDGRVALQDGPGAAVVPFETRVTTRTADVRFALDEIARLDAAETGIFRGRLDLSRIGAFGHSIGGVAAVQASAEDRRLSAVADLDGGTGEMADNLERGSPAPLMLLTKVVTTSSAPTDQVLSSWGMSRAQYDGLMAQARERQDELYRTMRAAGYRISIAGAAHMNFSDSALLEHDNRGINAERALRITSDYLSAFFGRYLAGRPSALLDGPSTAYPEVRWERFGPLQHGPDPEE